jgi:thiol-disulfide isomerase/thioredoxin
MSGFVELFGGDKKLKSKDGEVDVSSLSSKTAVLLYFSAHWCPPCRFAFSVDTRLIESEVSLLFWPTTTRSSLLTRTSKSFS